MDELLYNGQIINRIEISNKPDFVLADKILQKQCTNNSKKIVQQNPNFDIKYIEGIMLVIEKDGYVTAQPHAWNRFYDCYFDVTTQIVASIHPEVNSAICNYFPFREVDVEKLEMKNGILKFSKESEKFMNHYVKMFPKKQ